MMMRQAAESMEDPISKDIMATFFHTAFLSVGLQLLRVSDRVVTIIEQSKLRQKLLGRLKVEAMARLSRTDNCTTNACEGVSFIHLLLRATFCRYPNSAKDMTIKRQTTYSMMLEGLNSPGKRRNI